MFVFTLVLVALPVVAGHAKVVAAARRHTGRSAIAVAGLAAVVCRAHLVHHLGEEVGYLLRRLHEDVVQVARNVAVLLVEEADGLAGVAGAARAADAVHVLVDVGGQVEVDDELDVGDVEAAGGDGGRDQDGLAARAEAAEGVLALRLALVAVDADGRVVFVHQVPANLLRVF